MGSLCCSFQDEKRQKCKTCRTVVEESPKRNKKTNVRIKHWENEVHIDLKRNTGNKSLSCSLVFFKPTSACYFGTIEHISPQKASQQSRVLCAMNIGPKVSWKAHLASCFKNKIKQVTNKSKYSQFGFKLYGNSHFYTLLVLGVHLQAYRCIPKPSS